jgi:hypothetical protein
VRFEAVRTATVHKLLVTNGSGRVLVSAAGAGESRVMTVMEGRLTMKLSGLSATSSIDAVAERLVPEGDQQAFADLLLSPEAAILPHLSRELGRRGITGRDYPASFDIHSFAMLTGRVHDVKLPAIEAGDGSEGEGLRVAQAACVHPPEGSKCFGMCGPGCSCWKWVCGDCCWHKGCAAHDNDCRKCSWKNPWACTKCASFASFFTGGGCAN